MILFLLGALAGVLLTGLLVDLRDHFHWIEGQYDGTNRLIQTVRSMRRQRG